MHPVPSSLMEDDGTLISGSEGKSKLMTELGKQFTSHSITKQEDTCYVLDGMYIVNKMEPRTGFVKNGTDLAKVFTDYVDGITEEAANVCVVFDTYRPLSLKNFTRKKRKKGKCVATCRVGLNTNLTKMSLKKLLLNDQSKGYLASFLAEEICKHFHLMGKGCMVTADNKTNVNMGEAYNEDNHEEADTMIIYHVIHASKSCNRIVVQCSDTDVFVGLIAYASQIDSECLMQVAPDKIYNIKAISASIGEERSRGLMALHTLTGCDITGKFRGKSKIPWLTAYLKETEDIINYFVKFPYFEDPLEDLQIFEKFVCRVYCPDTEICDLGAARWMMWTQSKNIDRIPPTIGALTQGVKRAWYASKVMGQSDVFIQILPNPDIAGWRLDNENFEPITSEESIAPDSVIELVSCGCKRGCKSSRCSCRKLELCCTDLCSCFDFCENTDPPMGVDVNLD